MSPRTVSLPSTPRVVRALVAFELRYQLRQPAFWIATFAFIALGITLIAADIGGLESVRGRVPRNVPLAVATNIQMMSAIGMFVTFVFVSGSVLRDVTTGIEPLILSKPISSRALLLGRFVSGLFVSLVSIGAGVAAMFAASVVLEDSGLDLLPPDSAPYAYGVIVLLLTNVLLFAAAIFVLALWTRRLTATFLGLFVLMIAQDIAEALPVAKFGEILPSLLDPLGFAALATATRYWSVWDLTVSMPPLGGLVLANRVLWLSVAVGLVAFGVWRFDPRRLGSRARPTPTTKKGERREPAVSTTVSTTVPTTVSTIGPPARSAPTVTPRLDAYFGPRCTLRIARFEFGQMARSLPFVMIVLVGMLAIGFGISQRESIIGVASLPLTRVLLSTVVRASYLPLTVIAVLFTGAVVWRERATRMSATLDAYPAPLGALVCGKALAVGALLATAMTAFGVTAQVAQSALGFERVEIGLLATGLGLALVPYLILAAIAIALQTLAGSRLLGHVLVCIVVVGRLGLRAAGHDGAFVDLGAGPLPSYSDIDGWGGRARVLPVGEGLLALRVLPRPRPGRVTLAARRWAGLVGAPTTRDRALAARRAPHCGRGCRGRHRLRDDHRRGDERSAPHVDS